MTVRARAPCFVKSASANVVKQTLFDGARPYTTFGVAARMPQAFRTNGPYIRGMDRFGLVLRTIVFFLFPIPFLLSFASGQGADWTAYVAYTAVAALVIAAGATAWTASRRGRKP